MNLKLKICFITVLFINLNNQTLICQKISELEKKRKKITEEIDYLNNLLKSTKKKQKVSLNQLIILEKKIKAQEKKIENLQAELDEITQRIEELNKKINMLDLEFNTLKESYKKLLIIAYKTKTNYDKFYFVFSDYNFNKAYRRFKYLQYYGEYRQKQIKKILKTKKEYTYVKEQLNVQKNKKEKIMQEIENEKLKLKKNKIEQTNLLDQLKKEEKNIKSKLEKQKKAAKQLENTIKKLIEEEKKERAQLANDKKNKKTHTTFSNVVIKPTPEEALINADFEKNKNLLPWPVEKGIIISSFGEQEHPVFKNIKIRNDGIQIATLPNSKVRAVFNGVVSNVVFIPNKNYVVIIKHGNYYTVYTNLIETYVKKGDKIKTKQIIGIAGTDQEEEKTYIEFQIWYNNNKLNPEDWLAKSKN